MKNIQYEKEASGMDVEQKQLERAIDEITEIATTYGLDFYPMRYEICPSEIIYTFGAYGMPTRFSHWSFGKQFYNMKMQYDFGLNKIYELVINSNPCYAFLLDSNSLVQNKLIIAHVLAHCDFFKNNLQFKKTNRNMVESMSVTAERIREYEDKYGKVEVEKTLDAILAIQEHIDPSLLSTKELSEDDPTKDILLFLMENSHELTDWQKDIVSMLREEMLYFWPQMQTKIMNEGWATYWHQTIMRDLDLSDDELLEYAKLHAGVLQPSRTSINPYYLGVKIFTHIEERWNKPTEEMKRYGAKPNSGREKIFEVRELESDQSFLRNYITKQLVEEEDLFLFEKQGRDYKISSKNWEEVRDQLVGLRVNGGFPYIVVIDGDYRRNGELYLKHSYEGMELDFHYVEKVFPYLYHLWGKKVYIETVENDEEIVLEYDGSVMRKKRLK